MFGPTEKEMTQLPLMDEKDKKMGQPDGSRGGYDRYELVSALQKSIRRGQEELAYFWALEMADSGSFWQCLHRLNVIAHEDVGLADPQAVMYAMACFRDAYDWYRNKRREWQMPLGLGILALCRAKKSRIGDHFQTAMLKRRADGWKPPIPDEARDKHTSRGKQMGRGHRFFVEVGSKLVNEATQLEVPDPYKAECETVMLKAADEEEAKRVGR